MRSLALLSCVLSSLGLFAQSPEKLEIIQRWKALQIELREAGQLETVFQYRGTLEQLPLEEPLKTRAIELWRDVQAFQAAQPSSLNRFVNIIPETEPNDSLEQAQQLDRNLDGVSGSIPAGTNDLDFFGMPLRAEPGYGFFNVRTNGDTVTGDSNLRLYNPAGQLVAENDDLNFIMGFLQSRIIWPISEAGTWTAEVGLSAFVTDDPGASLESYNFFFSQPKNFQTTQVLQERDIVVNRVSLTAGDKIEIFAIVDVNASVASYELDLVLKDPNGETIALTEDFGINFAYLYAENVPVSGNYTVELIALTLRDDSTPQPAMLSIDTPGFGLCAEPRILGLPPGPNLAGLLIGGSPGCSYTVTYTHLDGTQQVFDMMIGSDFQAVDNNHPVPEGTIIEVNQQGIVGNGTGQGAVTIVPTLGQWGLVGFILTLCAASLVLLRRKQRA